jgi:predicted Co/Zn/Cd cation transporter (cation efflux family)
MTTGKSLLTAAGVTLGAAAAVVSVDALWLMRQSARGVPGEFQTVDMKSVFGDMASAKGLLIAVMIFLFVFALAKTYRRGLGD